MTSQVLQARHGVALRLDAGQPISVVNTHGQQVVDTWAFNTLELSEFMSMEHSRVHMGRIGPVKGSVLLTNRRRPILEMIEDNSGGFHDTLMAACDVHRYRMMGCTSSHANCTDNLHSALLELGLAANETPAPLNLFQRSEIDLDGTLTIVPPVAPAGSHVTLRAGMDVVMVFSACPQDMAPTNGADMTPKDVELRY